MSGVGFLEMAESSSRRRSSLTPRADVEQPALNPPSRRSEKTPLLGGFPLTVSFLAAGPDKTAILFRRFDKSSIRNLLYLQGRVAALEKVQQALDEEDSIKFLKDEAILSAATSWEQFALLGSSARDMEDIPLPRLLISRP